MLESCNHSQLSIFTFLTPLFAPSLPAVAFNALFPLLLCRSVSFLTDFPVYFLTFFLESIFSLDFYFDFEAAFLSSFEAEGLPLFLLCPSMLCSSSLSSLHSFPETDALPPLWLYSASSFLLFLVDYFFLLGLGTSSELSLRFLESLCLVDLFD